MKIRALIGNRAHVAWPLFTSHVIQCKSCCHSNLQSPHYREGNKHIHEVVQTEMYERATFLTYQMQRIILVIARIKSPVSVGAWLGAWLVQVDEW